jgi:hypothetical protein
MLKTSNNNNNNDNTRKFPKWYGKGCLSATHPKPTWTSPVLKAKETEQNFEVKKLKASVLGEIQVVSATWFVKQTTPNLEKTTARAVEERNDTTGQDKVGQ